MATQKQIAERLGVSVSLVSRALSGTAGGIGVPEVTVRRIRSMAERMGYTPNNSARMLKGAAARTFGVVVYDFADPFFGPVIGALQRLAHEKQYSLVLGGFESRKVWNLDVAGLLKHQIDGLIIIGSGRDTGWARDFMAKGIPLVRIGSGPTIKGAHTVRVNERKAMAEVVAHVAALGHHRIAFAGMDHPVHRHRWDELSVAAGKVGLACTVSNRQFRSERLLEAGYAAARDLAIDGHQAPTAIVASNDVIALGLLRGLAERGVRVPADISVIGYDDIPLARLAVPSLTTVRQPIGEMVSTAFARMLDLVGGGSGGRASETVLNPELIPRESSGPI